MKKSRVAIALSGGVDSATAAACLLEQGHDVVGLTMQLWDHGQQIAPGRRSCCSLDDLHDARRVAETLGIPFYVVDFESLFRESVVKEFLSAPLLGLTPNPCIRCNQILKFQHLLHKARSLEADYLATGHYVRRQTPAGRPLELWCGEDPLKDQSYFLFATTQAQLAHLLFPLGHLTKGETRALAEKYGLHVAQKGESQDLCFVTKGEEAHFRATHHPQGLTPGEIVHLDGKVLGQHGGLGLYTVGQRKGLGISSPYPLYVVMVDAQRNRLWVGGEDALYRRELEVAELNWLGDEPFLAPRPLSARIRYAGQAHPALVTPLEGGRARVFFETPQRAITPGQACVFYHGERLMGGGWIQPAEPSAVERS